jgi:hypothetical protein
MTTVQEQRTVSPSTRSGPSDPLPVLDQFKSTLARFSLQDRMTVFGASALVLLSVLPWFSVEIPTEVRVHLDVTTSVSGLVSGWGWISLLSSSAVIAWHLVPRFRKAIEPRVPPPVSEWLPAAFSGIAFLLGPVAFLFHSSDIPFGGTTFFFWLAFLAGATSAGGAVWNKLLGAR